MIIAFTIGNTKSYSQSLEEYPDKCFKIGACNGYDGGWIWKTEQEAYNFIWSGEFLKIDWGDGILRRPKQFSVYKVELINGWDDVSPIPDKDGIFNLLVDSRFTK